MYFRYTQEELRSICRSNIEAFEYWARRVVHQKMLAAYGDNYFESDIGNSEKILSKEHHDKYIFIKRKHPERFSRPVDALFINALIYILCKPNLYSKYFKEILDYSYPQGVEEAREFLNRLVEPRNCLSHSNPISIRQAEQIACYSNDFIDGVKQYYLVSGCEKMWNVPSIIAVTDSAGNTFYPDDNHTISDVFRCNQTYRVGETFKICIEVDSSFDEDAYVILWSCDGIHFTQGSKEFLIKFEDNHIGNNLLISCKIVSNKSWHKHSGYDHQITLMLQVLPL